MAQGGVLGGGVRVGFSASSPVSWTTLKQLRVVQLPTVEPSEVESTTHATAYASALERTIRGISKVGDLAITLASDLDDATGTDEAAVRALEQSSVTVYWRVEVPCNRARTRFKPLEFSGWVKGYNVDTPMTGLQETRFAVRFDGVALNWDIPATDSPALAAS